MNRISSFLNKVDSILSKMLLSRFDKLSKKFLISDLAKFAFYLVVVLSDVVANNLDNDFAKKK